MAWNLIYAGICKDRADRRDNALEMTLIQKHRMIVMKVSGEIDHHTAGKMRTALETELKRTGAVNIALDLGDVGFMDSSGVGMIIGRYKTVSALGGNILIYNASSQIRRLLRMSGMQKIVIICDTLREGIDIINGKRITR